MPLVGALPHVDSDISECHLHDSVPGSWALVLGAQPESNRRRPGLFRLFLGCIKHEEATSDNAHVSSAAFPVLSHLSAESQSGSAPKVARVQALLLAWLREDEVAQCAVQAASRSAVHLTPYEAVLPLGHDARALLLPAPASYDVGSVHLKIRSCTWTRSGSYSSPGCGKAASTDTANKVPAILLTVVAGSSRKNLNDATAARRIVHPAAASGHAPGFEARLAVDPLPLQVPAVAPRQSEEDSVEAGLWQERLPHERVLPRPLLLASDDRLKALEPSAACLASLPCCVTVLQFPGRVLFQNARSSALFGDLTASDRSLGAPLLHALLGASGGGAAPAIDAEAPGVAAAGGIQPRGTAALDTVCIPDSEPGTLLQKMLAALRRGEEFEAVVRVPPTAFLEHLVAGSQGQQELHGARLPDSDEGDLVDALFSGAAYFSTTTTTTITEPGISHRLGALEQEQLPPGLAASHSDSKPAGAAWRRVVPAMRHMHRLSLGLNTAALTPASSPDRLGWPSPREPLRPQAPDRDAAGAGDSRKHTARVLVRAQKPTVGAAGSGSAAVDRPGAGIAKASASAPGRLSRAGSTVESPCGDAFGGPSGEIPRTTRSTPTAQGPSAEGTAPTAPGPLWLVPTPAAAPNSTEFACAADSCAGNADGALTAAAPGVIALVSSITEDSTVSAALFSQECQPLLQQQPQSGQLAAATYLDSLVDELPFLSPIPSTLSPPLLSVSGSTPSGAHEEAAAATATTATTAAADDAPSSSDAAPASSCKLTAPTCTSSTRAPAAGAPSATPFRAATAPVTALLPTFETPPPLTSPPETAALERERGAVRTPPPVSLPARRPTGRSLDLPDTASALAKQVGPSGPTMQRIVAAAAASAGAKLSRLRRTTSSGRPMGVVPRAASAVGLTRGPTQCRLGSATKGGGHAGGGSCACCAPDGEACNAPGSPLCAPGSLQCASEGNLSRCCSPEPRKLAAPPPMRGLGLRRGAGGAESCWSETARPLLPGSSGGTATVTATATDTTAAADETRTGAPSYLPAHLLPVGRSNSVAIDVIQTVRHGQAAEASVPATSPASSAADSGLSGSRVSSGMTFSQQVLGLNRPGIGSRHSGCTGHRSPALCTSPLGAAPRHHARQLPRQRRQPSCSSHRVDKLLSSFSQLQLPSAMAFGRSSEGDEPSRRRFSESGLPPTSALSAHHSKSRLSLVRPHVSTTAAALATDSTPVGTGSTAPLTPAGQQQMQQRAVGPSALPPRASRRPTYHRVHVAVCAPGGATTPGADGGDGTGAVDGIAAEAVAPCLTLTVTQVDVSEQMEVQTHLKRLLEQEHKVLESIFPRHVIEYMTLSGATGSAHTEAAPSVASRPGSPGERGAAGKCADGGSLLRLSTRGARKLASLATLHPCVTILFCDIVGFTSVCHECSPLTIMTFLNELYRRFDSLVDIYRVYKVETIGDCYMVAGGLVAYDDDGYKSVIAGAEDPLHALRVLEFAKAMLRAAREVALPHTGEPVQLRVGLHSGPVTSGVVGDRMPRFCLFGDTVNVASRMESTCPPGRIHVSAATQARLPREPWQDRGLTAIKGKGQMRTYEWAGELGHSLETEQLQRLLGLYL